MIKRLQSRLKPLASINLAIFILLSLAVISAVGTIYESLYDAETASVLVYKSVWMYGVLSLLVINLTAVMFDRWPWKERHTGFVLAHIGIIILLLGGLVTQQYGIDGTMYFQIGTSSRTVTVNEKELTVYSTFDGNRFVTLLQRPINLIQSPAMENPIRVPIDDGAIEIIDSLPYAQASERVVSSQGDLDGSGVRFQLYNERVNQLEWIVQMRSGKVAVSEFGPLQMILGTLQPPTAGGTNILALEVYSESLSPSGGLKDGDKKEGAEEPSSPSIRIKYAIFKKESAKVFKTGVLREGDEVELPWMNFKFKILRAHTKAHREWEVRSVEKPTATTTSAVLVRHKGQTQWAQLNDIVRFFTDQGAYLVKYGQSQVDIGEELYLKKFTIGRYQGTRRAMAYESVVTVPELGDITISMNDPLHYKGYTFYQASFQEDPRTGEPVASILSVNKDPGRELKYLGSLVMVLGIIHLFWFRRRQGRKPN